MRCARVCVRESHGYLNKISSFFEIKLGTVLSVITPNVVGNRRVNCYYFLFTFWDSVAASRSSNSNLGQEILQIAELWLPAVAQKGCNQTSY